MFKCIRCGWCCIFPKVLIIKPEFINSTICIDKTLEYFDKVIEKPIMFPCVHLEFNEEDGTSICKVHNYDWYETTSCYNFKTIEIPLIWFPKELINLDEECRIGKIVRNEYPIDWWKHWWEYSPIK